MSTKIEIERKFLLKNIPEIKYDKIVSISQFYLPDKLRIRIVSEHNKSKDTQIFWKNFKKRISDISSEETDEIITKEEFDLRKEMATKHIFKSRYIKEVNGLKWEIDSFLNMRLIIAEVEIPTEDYALELPDFIKDTLIMEVSTFKEFSNRNLAKDII